jgi:UDP-N-acetylmuramate--alanine ligase
MPMTEPRLARLSDLPGDPGRVFLLGVAGAGMRALAVALQDRGWTVAGSDSDADAATALSSRGIAIHDESDADAAREVDLVVYSSALPETHHALVAAREAGIPTWKRARALGALVNEHRLAAVAGTHGKTTVTTMLALAAEAAGMDPLALVGGRVGAWGGNTRLGHGELAVVEADEYDRSFLELDPDLAIVTSVEPEHLDVYGTVELMEAAFAEFAGRARMILACADDAGARRLAAALGAAGDRGDHGQPGDHDGQRDTGDAEVRTYGFAEDADYRLEVMDAGRGGQLCRLHGPGDTLPFRLGAPGAHNAQNAAAALAAAWWLGATAPALADALESFSGVDRRLQVLHETSALVVVDDYAHHPTEVRATLEALRSGWPGHRVVTVFQPHLYTRTRDHASEFSDALAGADRALVLPIYPSREAPLPGVTRDLILNVARRGLEPIEPDDVPGLLCPSEPTVLAFMGAGDVTRLAHDAARRAATRRPDELGG